MTLQPKAAQLDVFAAFDHPGEPLSKSARKKLGKQRDKQAKAFDAAQAAAAAE